MRDIPDAFAARLAASETTLCRCWRFVRRDGAVFGATDHDAPIVFDDVIHSPAAGLELVSFEGSAGLVPGRAAAEGALSLDFLNGADLDAGLWDGARVDVWRVDWREITHRLITWSGHLSEVSRAGNGFSAELVSMKAGLERSVGRVYSRRCDADIGDGRCGVELSSPAFTAEASVSHVLAAGTVRAGALSSLASGWLTGGRALWATGANAGLTSRIARHVGDAIDLVGVLRAPVSVGDSLVATAGCDKAFDTCKAKFGNGVRFRGFPHMPGPDAVIAGPALGGPNDGGRRE